jgi:hypothetical protein
MALSKHPAGVQECHFWGSGGWDGLVSGYYLLADELSTSAESMIGIYTHLVEHHGCRAVWIVIAEPNSVVVAESTRKLVGNLFELEDLGAKDLKGISQVFRVHAGRKGR